MQKRLVNFFDDKVIACEEAISTEENHLALRKFMESYSEPSKSRAKLKTNSAFGPGKMGGAKGCFIFARFVKFSSGK